MENTIPFKYTGPLDPEYDGLISITRQDELTEMIKGVSNHTYYALVGPRQTGKTTLLFQLMQEIATSLPGFQGLYLTLEDLVKVKYQDFYKNLARKIISSLSNRYQIQPASLREQYKQVETNLDLKDFLLDLARARLGPQSSDECIEFEAREHKGVKFVLLIDEIDAIPHDIMIEFVKTVRSIFIERLSVAGFKAYTMVLCGSADLASLTYGKTSPFNISKVIYLRDFTFEEIREWTSRIFHHYQISQPESFARRLFDETMGHPYLTQMLCFRIFKRLWQEDRHEVTQDDFQEVDQIITGGDINLLTTLERIKGDEILKEMTLKILRGEPIRYSRTHDIIYHLELAGAIRRNNEYCQIRNLIYEKFLKQHFNLIEPGPSLARAAIGM
ncbi:MAG: AAA-like domain-containing protein [bacterium]